MPHTPIREFEQKWAQTPVNCEKLLMALDASEAVLKVKFGGQVPPPELVVKFSVVVLKQYLNDPLPSF